MRSPRKFSVAVVAVLMVLAAGCTAVGFTTDLGADTNAQMQQSGQTAEPNDNRENATRIEPGQSVHGSIEAGDMDWYKFTATAGQAVRVGSLFGPFGSNITLYGPDGNAIATRGLGPRADAAGVIANESGTYYVKVAPAPANAGEYEFEVRTVKPDSFEPNDDREGAAHIEAGEQYNATLFEGEDDWYAFDVNKGENITATATTALPNSEIRQTFRVVLYGPDGNRVGELNTDPVGPGPANRTLANEIGDQDTATQYHVAEESGTYYVRIVPTGPEAVAGFVGYSLTVNMSDTTEETETPTQTPDDTQTETPQPTTETPTPSDTEMPTETTTPTPTPSDECKSYSLNETPVEIGTSVTGHLGQCDNTDIFTYHLEEGERISVNATVLQSQGEVYFQLAGENTSLTAEQFPDRPDVNESESVQIRNVTGADETGTYQLIVTAPESSVPATYTFTIHTSSGQPAEQPAEQQPAEEGVAYYQVDFVATDPIKDLRGPEGTYADDQLIRFVHGSTEKPVMRRAPGVLAYAENTELAERIESHEITVENGTATVTFTVAEGSKPVELSLVSYTKPGPGWSPATETKQEFVDAETGTFGSGTYTLTVSLPGEDAEANDDGTAAESGEGELSVVGLSADADGSDNNNLNDEYIVYENTGTEPLNLTGWTVTDSDGNTFTFPDGFTLAPGEQVTLYTGSGTNTDSALYWGQASEVWNNGADMMTVRNAAGEIVLQRSYP